MRALVPAMEDIENRRPVWEALSDLFLDTDVALSRIWRIEKLAASSYTVPELEQILVDEVYPVCGSNLLSVAGEWAGFDMTSMEDLILRRLNSPLRRLRCFNLGRLMVHLSSEWQATKHGIEAVRAGKDGNVGWKGCLTL